LVNDVETWLASPIVNVEGPLIFVQAYLTIEPSGSLEDPPFSVVLFVGKVMLISEPALATGARLAASTVTVTSSTPVAPLSSVTCKRKTYTPAARDTVGVAVPALPMLYCEGPPTFVQA